MGIFNKYMIYKLYIYQLYTILNLIWMYFREHSTLYQWLQRVKINTFKNLFPVCQSAIPKCSPSSRSSGVEPLAKKGINTPFHTQLVSNKTLRRVLSLSILTMIRHILGECCQHLLHTISIILVVVNLIQKSLNNKLDWKLLISINFYYYWIS